MGLVFFLILLRFYIVNLSAKHFLNIGGGIKALPSPPPNFLRGTIPPVPPKSPPLALGILEYEVDTTCLVSIAGVPDTLYLDLCTTLVFPSHRPIHV